MHEKLKGEMLMYQAELGSLMRGEVAAFNQLMKDSDLSGVIMPPGGGR